MVFYNPRVLTLYTDARAMGLFVASPEEVVAEFCDKGITHVASGDFGTGEPGLPYLLAAIEERPDAFRFRWQNDEIAFYSFDSAVCAQ